MLAEIAERAGVEVDELPHAQALGWFPGPNGQPTLLRRGEPGLQPNTVIVEMFQNDDAFRVYAVSNDPKGPPPSRYTLSKTAPVYLIEAMSLETFMEEIAQEWREVAEDAETPEDAAEEERETVAVWLEKQIGQTQLAQQVRDGEHLEEDEPEENGVAVSSTPTMAVAPPPEVTQ